MGRSYHDTRSAVRFWSRERPASRAACDRFNLARISQMTASRDDAGA
jgi:hypothetical protein